MAQQDKTPPSSRDDVEWGLLHIGAALVLDLGQKMQGCQYRLCGWRHSRSDGARYEYRSYSETLVDRADARKQLLEVMDRVHAKQRPSKKSPKEEEEWIARQVKAHRKQHAKRGA